MRLISVLWFSWQTNSAESHGIDVSLFSLNWFLCIFVDSTPVNTYLHIWDAFLFEGSKVLRQDPFSQDYEVPHYRFYSAMLWRSWPPYSTSCWSRRSTWPSSTPSGQRWRQAWIPRRLPRLMNHVLSKIILIILPDCISWYQPFSFPCDQEQERAPCQDIPGIALRIQLDYNILLCVPGSAGESGGYPAELPENPPTHLRDYEFWLCSSW